MVSGVCGMANESNSTSQMVFIRKAARRFICDGLDAGNLCPNKSIHWHQQDKMLGVIG